MTLALMLALAALARCQASNGTTDTTTAPAASITPDSLGPCKCPASYLQVCEQASGSAILTGVCPCPNGYNKACIPAPPPGCPWSCGHLDPFAPDKFCDITANCLTPSPNAVGAAIPASYCGCRAGFKADGVADNDVTKQWRLPAPEGHFRVYVAPGVSCNTPCSYPWGPDGCPEVTLLSAECLIFRFEE